jgi:hypothetical protein
MEFELTTQYRVSCEGCDAATPYFDEEKTADNYAKRHGWIAVDDVSGLMNWCPRCKTEVPA